MNKNLNDIILYGLNKYTCWRKQLLAYFGEIFDAKECNRGCDNCKRNGDKYIEENGNKYIERIVSTFQFFDRPPV